MARDRPPTALRRTLVTRRTGWALAAMLALLGILLGAQQLTGAANLARQALGEATRLLLDTGWLLLLLAAAWLAARLARSSPRGWATARWLQARLTTRLVRWTAAALGVLVLLVLVVVVLPPRFTILHHFDKASEELKAQNDVRTTLLQALAGGVLLLGAYFTYRQLRVTREGQITDRYTKAVDQLGSEHLDVRVGGIYALERIARDSQYDRATIEEILTAYVRDHAPWPPPPAAPSLQAITQWLVAFAQRQRSALQRRTAKAAAGQEQQGQPDKKGAEPQGPPADVQAAMTVLGRRGLPPGGPFGPLDLTRVDLQRTQLGEANLQHAMFAGANLQGAALDGANLQHARFGGANLQGADLQGATLIGADLQGARLGGANLQDARASKAERGPFKATRWPEGWTQKTAEDRGVQWVD
jgi:hypothetical protein